VATAYSDVLKCRSLCAVSHDRDLEPELDSSASLSRLLTNRSTGQQWDTKPGVSWTNPATQQSGTHTHTRLTAPCPGLPGVSRYQKGKTKLDFTEARDSEWQWYQLGHMQVCTSLQTDIHANTPPLSFLQAGCSSCHPTNTEKLQSGRLTVKTGLDNKNKATAT